MFPDVHQRKFLLELPVAVYFADAAGSIVCYNGAAADLWGSDSPVWQDPSPDSSGIRHTSGGTIQRRDGTQRRIKHFSQAVLDAKGKPLGTLNLHIDITDISAPGSAPLENGQATRSLEKIVDERTADLERISTEMKKSEARYNTFVGEVEDYAMIVLDKSGVIINWNKGAEKIKGYSEGQALGKHFEMFYLPEDRKSGLPARLLEEAATKGKALHEGWRVRKDGSTFWGSISITSLHDDHGNVIGFYKVTRDLTNQKMAEDAIRQYTADLEFKNKELEQFAYVAAHDMKEPLRKILFYNSCVLENIGSALPAKEREYLNRSMTASARMKQMIDDILIYSAASDARIIETIDLNDVMTSVLELYHDTITDANAIITVDTLPVIKGIPVQFRQLFDNLIGNSFKYRDASRPLHLSVTSEKILAPVNGMPADGDRKKFWKLSFSDNGIGFDMNEADKIFDLFHRLPNSVQSSGSGIGLTLCKKIAQNHKGHITAFGKVGEGATFDVYLPR
jgi:PAS domain S-box-containing protein